MPLLILLAAFLALGQEVEFQAPWLTVYDAAGRPRWEVTLARLARTEEGWEGEEVEVRLYWEGERKFLLFAPRIQADKLGRNWTLSGGITGKAAGLEFSCESATWEGSLRLTGLSAQGEELSLVAEGAAWSGGNTVSLLGVRAQTKGWEVELGEADYDLEEGVLSGRSARIVGHGFELLAERACILVREGGLELEGASVLPHP
ncbi:MAG: hypothetical protein XD60_0877 [Acetothermia bacterium 64_32]|nr:MAG: hypothetical protein XD60_0877 [Acetothermia bacterium 64_32]HAF70722.1 hypothetical protein [Candidatus Acetothermia bacterium]